MGLGPRRIPASIALAAGVLLLAPALPAANRGVPLASGDRATASVDAPGDEDSFLVSLAKGGGLSAKLKAAQGSPLLPSIGLLRPDGSAIPLDGLVKGLGKPSLSTKPVLAGVDGEFAVVVSGSGGTTGAYELTVKATAPKGTIKGRVVPASGTLDFPFGGTDGAVVSVQLKETAGGPLSSVVLVEPDGSTLPLTLVRKKTTLKGSGIVLGGGVGLYAVRAAAAGGGSVTVDAKIKVKVGKDALRTVALGAEPIPSGFAPGTGIDGDAVAVAGTGFVEGARVFFGEVEATGVVVDSATSLSCTAPRSAGSDAGAAVEVVVLNPDGQAGAAPGTFQFLGIPSLASASPAFQPLGGGSTITVSGARFRSGFSLTLGGTPVPSALLVNSGSITFTAPARAEGIAAIAVTDEFGRTATLPLGLQYTGGPTLAAATPDSASFTGGRAITLTGTRFRAATRVFVGGAEVTPVTVLSSTSLRFAMPAGPAGTLDVHLRDEFNQSVTVEDMLARRGPFARKASAVPAGPSNSEIFGTSGALGDLDGDGAPDLVLATAYPPYDSTTYSSLPGSRILVNDGSGSFSDGTADRHGSFSYQGDYGQASTVALGDLDGDDRVEAILTLDYPLAYPGYWFTVGSTKYAYYILGPGGGYYADYFTYGASRLLSNDGSGYLTNDSATRLPALPSSPVFGAGERLQGADSAVGDLDGDGEADLVLAGTPIVYGTISYTKVGSYGTYLRQSFTYSAGTRVLLNSGGTLAYPSNAMPALTYTKGPKGTVVREDWGGDAVALGDLDGDGDEDLLVARARPGYYYKFNAGAGYYYTYFDFATRLLRNGGSGTFTNSSSTMPASYALTHPSSFDYGQADCLALGDLDGDGDLDAVLGRNQAYYWYDKATSAYRLDTAIRILRNNGAGTFTDATSSFLADSSWRTGSSSTILSAASVRIGDLDGIPAWTSWWRGPSTASTTTPGAATGTSASCPRGSGPGPASC